MLSISCKIERELTDISINEFIKTEKEKRGSDLAFDKMESFKNFLRGKCITAASNNPSMYFAMKNFSGIVLASLTDKRMW